MERTSRGSSLMEQRIFVFKTFEKILDGRPKLLAIPENQIKELSTIYGSQNVFVYVNGIKVDYSFDQLIKELGVRHDCF
jgi:hypothetical protein